MNPHDFFEARRAIRAKETDTIRRMLDQGMDVNLSPVGRCSGEDTFLILAAKYGAKAICALFLEHGADIHARNKSGRTALVVAAEKWDVDFCELLVAAGSDPSGADEAGITPLHSAARYGKIASCRFLLGKCADVNARDKTGATPLHYSARSQNSEVCCFLLENGADPNVANDKGLTPLHYAVDMDSDAQDHAVLMMLERGASAAFVPQHPERDYLTPFQTAVRWNRTGFVQLFFDQSGEDPQQLTFAGQTMEELAGDAPAMHRLLRALITEREVGGSISGIGRLVPAAPRRSSGPAIL